MPRPACRTCGRPSRVCVCHLVVKQSNHLPIVILQHPDEQGHPLNTAGLAVRGLCQAKLLVGLHWSRETLRDCVGEEWVQSAALLYPETEATLKNSSSRGSAHQEEEGALIVLDGTWRNTREMLLCNPWLKELPRISLNDHRSSEYRIRRSQKAGGLSTIEAIAGILAQQQEALDVSVFLKPFQQMIEQHIALMGEEVYSRHYGDLENS